MKPDYRRIRLTGFAVLLLGMCQMLLAGQVTAQAAGCADYSSASAAQFALDINPALASTLDPDGNGVACDDASSGQTGTSGTDRSSTDLQLPGMGDPTPTPSGQLGQPTDVDAVDQQPTGGLTPPAQPPLANQQLDGRIGGSRASWEAIHGAPTDEQPGSRPEIALTSYSPIPTSSDVIALWFNDQAFILVVTAESSWSGADVATIIMELLPSDITSIPDGEILNDGSVLIPMTSQQLAPAVTPELMADAGAPGVPGDLYLLLITDGGERAAEIEIGIGNGDNVREDINGASTTTGQPTPATTTLPTPTPATTTSVDTSIFLQETRVEVNLLLAEYDEFMAILAAGTFTDAEIDRMSTILSGWATLDTSLPTVSPEHAALAAQLQGARADLSGGALQVLTWLDSNDDAALDQAFILFDSAHTNLLDIDQQLTALGV